MNERNSYVQVRRILLGILILNFAVALSKIIIGSLTKTSSIVADGYHSVSDGASNIVGLFGVWIASKPADEKHPYGHYKFETLATIIISLLLFFISFEILKGAFERYGNPVVPEIGPISFIVMITTLLINLWITWYETKKGRELKSSFLISDAKHTKSDIYVTISVLASLFAIRQGFIIIDSIASGIIAILIIKAGLEILIPSIHVLSDATMLDSNKIYELVINIPEVIYCHKIRTRGKEN